MSVVAVVLHIFEATKKEKRTNTRKLQEFLCRSFCIAEIVTCVVVHGLIWLNIAQSIFTIICSFRSILLSLTLSHSLFTYSILVPAVISTQCKTKSHLNADVMKTRTPFSGWGMQ